MFTFSCWTFNKDYTMDEIIKKMNSNPNMVVSSEYTITLSCKQGFDLDNPSTLSIVGKSIRFISFRLSLPSNNQSVVKDVDVIIYEYDGKIKINSFRGFKTSQKVLRDYFNERSDWNKIVSAAPEISEDLLYWLFKSYIDKSKTSSLDTNSFLYLHSLKRYKGVTKDQGNTLTGEGDRISDILGTLAFLLDNDDLKLLKAQMVYKTPNDFHSLVFEMKLTGTLKFDSSFYRGNFNFTGDNLTFALSILITNVIMPIVISSYKNAIQSTKWSALIKRDFIERIGERIKERVDIELEKISAEITPQCVNPAVATTSLDSLAIDDLDELDELDDSENDSDE